MNQSSITYSGNSFLIWGYSTVFVSLLVFVCLKLTGNEIYYCFYVGVPILANLIIRLTQKDYSRSDTEILVNKVWALFGGLTLLLYVGRYYCIFPLFAIVSSLMGIETIVTAIIIKCKIVALFGIVGILGAIPLLLVSGHEQNLIIAIVFIFISVIPGYVINYKTT
ncbi:hypothetical protein [uncultured Parabacteroides sp.]|uniref:hypothetical protein n=1 Tax=uncultured Parabacteroides sp. TaxID=512312 RepID=UPI0025D1FDB5|nr:hypothetical protein [uncultured Parabacteroides sp.]